MVVGDIDDLVQAAEVGIKVCRLCWLVTVRKSTQFSSNKLSSNFRSISDELVDVADDGVGETGATGSKYKSIRSSPFNFESANVGLISFISKFPPSGRKV